MHIMNYRARFIGGSLKVESGENRGVAITCLFPLANGMRDSRNEFKR